MAFGGRRMTSLFRFQGNTLEYVTAGAVFRRQSHERLTEIAEITALYADAAGVPHLRFDLVFRRRHAGETDEGPRVLAARAFFDQFSERVPRGAPAG